MGAEHTYFNDATHDSTITIAKPVMVIQGFAGHDFTTLALTAELNKSKSNGIKAYGSGTGFNPGLSDSFYTKLQEQLDYIYDKHDGKPVGLMGHSLGGIMSLLLAYDNPEKVDSVMTIGSPFEMMFGPKGRNINIIPMNKKDRELYNRLKEHIHDAPPEEIAVTSIYSPNGDCVIRGEGGRNPWDGHDDVQNISVDHVGHIEMLYHPKILELISLHHDPHSPYTSHEAEGQTASPVVV